jgi:4a-hydroxytetrahydrobiopterin dehydratase
MPALNAKKIAGLLKTVPAWSKHRRTIGRTFKFKGFEQSIAFVQQIARRAQKMNHHPDIFILFDQVTLTLTTHDAGGLTKKDFVLASQCDQAFLRIAN